VLSSAGLACGQVNGMLKPAHTLVSTQQNATGFGDSNLGQINFANGSELDAAHFYVSGGDINFLLAGNLESNFNKLVVFIDNGSGLGQNQISGGMGLPNQYTGMRFDNGFNATHWLSFTGGDVGGGVYGFFVDGADLLSNAGGYIGGNDGQNGGTLTGGSYAFPLLAAINNSNTGGVTGASGAGGASVTTGLEFQFPMAAIGAAGAFRVCAFINGSNHDYASNQFLAPLASGTGNLGGDGMGTFTGSLSGIDLNSFAGNQYFTVPAPASLALMGLAGMVVGRRRR
jgi:hypothetical protein